MWVNITTPPYHRTLNIIPVAPFVAVWFESIDVKLQYFPNRFNGLLTIKDAYNNIRSDVHFMENNGEVAS